MTLTNAQAALIAAALVDPKAGPNIDPIGYTVANAPKILDWLEETDAKDAPPPIDYGTPIVGYLQTDKAQPRPFPIDPQSSTTGRDTFWNQWGMVILVVWLIMLGPTLAVLAVTVWK